MRMYEKMAMCRHFAEFYAKFAQTIVRETLLTSIYNNKMKTKTENNWTHISSGRLQRLSALMVCMCLGVFTAFAQKTVRGSVTDVNGDPLAGVSVVTESNGRRTGTVTDIDGNYSITVPGGEQ